MTTENLDNVMRRVQKLLAIANDGRGSPEEAAAAAGMAERIMAKYQIEHADLVKKDLATGSNMETVNVVVTAKTNGTKVKAVPAWADMLAYAVSMLHDVGAAKAFTLEGEMCVRYYGYSADVKVAAWTLGYLVHTVNQLCATFRSNPVYQIGGRTAMNSYRMGVVSSIIRMLQERTAAKRQEATSTGTSLMVLKRDAIAEHFGSRVVTGRKIKTRDSTDPMAFLMGRNDGRSVQIAAGAVEG